MRVFTVGDFGKDLDDEVALLAAVSLHKMGLIELVGTIANLHPAESRARLAKGSYDALGVDIPVAVGTSCGWDKPAGAYEFDVPYLAPADRVEPSGADLFTRAATESPDKGLHLILMSGFTDALQMMLLYPELFKAKVGSVTLMSGIEPVEPPSSGRYTLGDVWLKPDHTANNDFDYRAALGLYVHLQIWDVPMTVVTRDAAYAARVPRAFYDGLAATGHPIGLRLQAAQERSIQQLWEQANLPRYHPDRTLPWGPEDAPRTADWFKSTFCNGAGEDKTGADQIWNDIIGFAQYDALAVIASHPTLRDQFFTPTMVNINGINHRVIGASTEKSGIPDPQALTRFLTGTTTAAMERP